MLRPRRQADEDEVPKQWLPPYAGAAPAGAARAGRDAPAARAPRGAPPAGAGPATGLGAGGRALGQDVRAISSKPDLRGLGQALARGGERGTLGCTPALQQLRQVDERIQLISLSSAGMQGSECGVCALLVFNFNHFPMPAAHAWCGGQPGLPSTALAEHASCACSGSSPASGAMPHLRGLARQAPAGSGCARAAAARTAAAAAADAARRGGAPHAPARGCGGRRRARRPWRPHHALICAAVRLAGDPRRPGRAGARAPAPAAARQHRAGAPRPHLLARPRASPAQQLPWAQDTGDGVAAPQPRVPGLQAGRTPRLCEPGARRLRRAAV